MNLKGAATENSKGITMNLKGAGIKFLINFVKPS